MKRRHDNIDPKRCEKCGHSRTVHVSDRCIVCSRALTPGPCAFANTADTRLETSNRPLNEGPQTESKRNPLWRRTVIVSPKEWQQRDRLPAERLAEKPLQPKNKPKRTLAVGLLAKCSRCPWVLRVRRSRGNEIWLIVRKHCDDNGHEVLFRKSQQASKLLVLTPSEKRRQIYADRGESTPEPLRASASGEGTFWKMKTGSRRIVSGGLPGLGKR